MSKKTKTDYPSGSRTSWKVVITYTFVLALCAALFYYIFNLRNSIENQRSNINTQHDARSVGSTSSPKTFTAHKTQPTSMPSPNKLNTNASSTPTTTTSRPRPTRS